MNCPRAQSRRAHGRCAALADRRGGDRRDRAADAQVGVVVDAVGGSVAVPLQREAGHAPNRRAGRPCVPMSNAKIALSLVQSQSIVRRLDVCQGVDVVGGIREHDPVAERGHMPTAGGRRGKRREQRRQLDHGVVEALDGAPITKSGANVAPENEAGRIPHDALRKDGAGARKIRGNPTRLS